VVDQEFNSSPETSLHKNPFFFLWVTTRDSRNRIVEFSRLRISMELHQRFAYLDGPFGLQAPEIGRLYRFRGSDIARRPFRKQVALI
jgi:hypothetical protein